MSEYNINKDLLCGIKLQKETEIKKRESEWYIEIMSKHLSFSLVFFSKSNFMYD